MLESKEGKAQAQALFLKAAPNYHAITRNTVAEMLAH
jgi:hypothetical protein